MSTPVDSCPKCEELKVKLAEFAEAGKKFQAAYQAERERSKKYWVQIPPVGRSRIPTEYWPDA